MSNHRHPLAELFDGLVEVLKPALDKVKEMMRDLNEFIKRNEEYQKQRAKSLKPTAPTRIDTRRVTHTDTKPPKPSTFYRRRTP